MYFYYWKKDKTEGKDYRDTNLLFFFLSSVTLEILQMELHVNGNICFLNGKITAFLV